MPTSVSSIFLRVAAVATTLVAAIVMGMNEETNTLREPTSPSLKSPIIAAAKAAYSSEFVYFMVANAIACAYSALSLAISMFRGSSTREFMMALAIADLMMVALLFSSNGAAAAFGVLGKYGNKHVNWDKVCDVFERFCSHVMASIAISLLGSIAYVVLIVLTIVGLHRMS